MIVMIMTVMIAILWMTPTTVTTTMTARRRRYFPIFWSTRWVMGFVAAIDGLRRCHRCFIIGNNGRTVVVGLGMTAIATHGIRFCLFDCLLLPLFSLETPQRPNYITL
jgi:hypothetical protein